MRGVGMLLHSGPEGTARLIDSRPGVPMTLPQEDRATAPSEYSQKPRQALDSSGPRSSIPQEVC
jgi:hypothetical protein